MWQKPGTAAQEPSQAESQATEPVVNAGQLGGPGNPASLLEPISKEILETVESAAISGEYSRRAADDEKSRFNWRGFHDTLLASGQIPLALARWAMTGHEDQMRKLDIWNMPDLTTELSARR